MQAAGYAPGGVLTRLTEEGVAEAARRRPAERERSREERRRYAPKERRGWRQGETSPFI